MNHRVNSSSLEPLGEFLLTGLTFLMIESSSVHGILITHVISHNFLENAKYSTKLLAVREDDATWLPCRPHPFRWLYRRN